jgi:hypothetical protein
MINNVRRSDAMTMTEENIVMEIEKDIYTNI